MAFNPKAIGGGVLGAITVSVMNSIRYGVARGVFSNEAGLGSAAITAAAAKTTDPVRQGYINMTGTFFDTIIVCTLTGVAIAASGVLGTCGADGEPLQGIQITMAAFSTILGPFGSTVVSIGIVLFAFSTILGWEYHGEKGWEYLFGTHKFNIIYRLGFSLVVYFGATQSLDLVWNFSDIANALMAIPNLLAMLVLSNVVVKEVHRFQAIIDKEKEDAKLGKRVLSEEI
jgi:AGCS family alanine or glycine:cation symporter